MTVLITILVIGLELASSGSPRLNEAARACAVAWICTRRAPSPFTSRDDAAGYIRVCSRIVYVYARRTQVPYSTPWYVCISARGKVKKFKEALRPPFCFGGPVGIAPWLPFVPPRSLSLLYFEYHFRHAEGASARINARAANFYEIKREKCV